VDGEVQHVNVDNASLNVSTPLEVIPAPYHGSPFGGFRVAADFLSQDNVHLYPGPSTAYEPEKYGFEADGGAVGTITHIPNESALRLSVSAQTNGAKARLRTHDQVRYQAGAATHIKLTGYATGGTLFSVIRSSASGAVVETKVAYTAWSEDASAVDVTKGNIYEIMYQWLGVGEVMYFVNGVLRNIVSNAGQLSAPFMKTANLPLSIEVVNDGATQYIRFGQFDDSDGVYFELQRSAAVGAYSFTHICSSARILNGIPYPTVAFGFSLATTGIGATLVPLFSLRVKSTLNGIASRVHVLPSLLSCFAETQAGNFALVMNPTLTGPTWVATSPSGAVEIDTAANAQSGGTEFLRVGLGANTNQVINLTEIFTIPGTKIRRQAFTGTSDVLTIGVVREGAVNFSPRATLNWREVR
jgi:hypothetical protein